MTEVTPVGRVRRVLTYTLCVFMVLSGPGFLAIGLSLDADVWACVLIAVVMSLVLVPLGVALWSDVRRATRELSRSRR